MAKEPTKAEPKKVEPEEKGYVTKSDFEKFTTRMAKKTDEQDDFLKDFAKTVGDQISRLSKPKEAEVHGELLTPSSPLMGDELGNPGPIEKVSDADFAKAVDMEGFMNQKLLIHVMPTVNKEDNPVVVPAVNGVNMPILRGVDTYVKRKFVEALARCRHTRFEQRIPDSANPDKFVMDHKTSVKDPFVVKYDPHKYGAQWLDAIVKEAA